MSRYLVFNHCRHIFINVLHHSFHPLYRGTWFSTVSHWNANVYTSVKFPSAISRYLVFNFALYLAMFILIMIVFPSAISRYLVFNVMPTDYGSKIKQMFPSAISRYLVFNPTRKTPLLTSGGGNGLHTPRRIDHIPTFASLNHDKNTRSTRYTPNAGIELSETTPPPLQVNPVQNSV